MLRRRSRDIWMGRYRVWFLIFFWVIRVLGFVLLWWLCVQRVVALLEICDLAGAVEP